MLHTTSNKQAIESCLLGGMLGDTVGLPYEGLGGERIRKLTHGQFRQSLLFGYGMTSDDTEHAILTYKSLYSSSSLEQFGRTMAWRLRWWLARLPAGIGLATGRALLKLWIGFNYKNSGVFSAGNGPAMRAPILGVTLGKSSQALKEFVAISTRITHTDIKAYIGSLAIAHASFMSSQNNYEISNFLHQMKTSLNDIPQNDQNEFLDLMKIVQTSVDEGSANNLVRSLKLEKGISGYIYHTVPIVLAVFFIYRKNYRSAIEYIILLGGDTDTTAAIAGGVIGAGLHKSKFPQEWVKHIVDYPSNPNQVKVLSSKPTASDTNTTLFRWEFGPLIFLRNIFFLAIVLVHGVRRIFPPY